MFCYKCGKEVSDESRFCTYCGVKLEYKTPASENVYAETNLEISDEEKRFVKEIAKYFIGLGLYIIGMVGCFDCYKKMISLEEIILSYFDSDNHYDLLLFGAFICTVTGLFLMLGNMVEAKLVFKGAPVLAVLACIFFGMFFIWAIVALVPYIDASVY